MRAIAMGREGMVCAANPLAVLAGVKMLARGGNAVDALVAAAVALNVVEPYMSGIGGVGNLLFYHGEERRVRALYFGGRAPARARLEGYTPEMKDVGPLAPLVPSALAGWARALADHGTLAPETVLQPAIALAERGIVITPFDAHHFAAHPERVELFPATSATYFPQGRPPAAGELLRQPDLARTLDLIARRGVGALYSGEIGRAIAGHLQSAGGVMTEDDLARVPEELAWQDPIHTSYRGYEIFTPPPPSSGAQILQTLNVLEGFDLAGMGHNTGDHLVTLAEVIRLARLDTDRYIGDPDFVEVPVDYLIGKEHAAEQRARVLAALRDAGDRKTGGRAGRGGAGGKGGRAASRDSTTHLAAADRWGNAVNMTQTLGSGFGSGVVIPGTGVCLNNGMRWFNLRPGHANTLAGGRRVEWCIAPTQAMRGGRLAMTVGSPGSYGIPQTVTQVLCNLIDFGMNVQDAIGAPRMRWADDVPDPLPATTLRVETRIPEDTRRALAARGYDLHLLGEWSWLVGGAHGIVVHGEGWLMGGADPRRNGYAIGW
ncbi:MAG: gamma-glutamyltransferase [Armatimonadetes bacterium]|nr:gamma-glutamyltransferase [Armatimonadota bacterium]